MTDAPATRLLALASALVVLLSPLPAKAQAPSPVRVAAGHQHTLVVDSAGAVWGWGGNGNGELGDNSTTTRKIPQLVPGLSNVVAVAAGTSHSLALTASGTVHAFGDNLYGQIGDGTTTDRRTAVALSLTTVVAIAAGDHHSMALRSNGDVYVWGRNNAGQIGNGTTTNVTAPSLLTTGAQAIAAGGSHTLVVKTDGTVWGVGADAYGQLGTGATATSRTGMVQMNGVAGGIAASAGAKHSVVLLADGTLRAAGYNGQGQLGDGTTSNRTTAVTVSGLTGIAAIEAGADHTVAAAADGTLWSWGEMGTGKLGTGATANQTTPVVVTGAGAVAALAAGGDHTVGVSASGVVRTWGENAQSQLGEGTTADVGVPIAISDAAYAWKVATPTFSVGSGTYTSERTVTISVLTSGATIRYTLTGAEPTESDPVVASGGTVAITQSQTLMAKAWKPGVPTSNVARADYVLQVVTPTNTPASGTYSTAQTVTLATTTAGATLRYTLDGTDPTAGSPLYAGSLTVGTTTTVKVVGFKPNWASSAVRTATYTMNFGTLTAPTIGPAGGTVTGQATVTLSAQPFATIRYTTNGTTPTTTSPLYTAPFAVTTTTQVRAKAFHPDYTASAVSTADYTIVTSTPTFSLPSGAYAPGTTVTVSDADAGVTLRWTLDGTDPTSASPVLPNSPLVLGEATIKVRAFRPGASDSAVATAAYTLTAPLGPGGVSAGDRHMLLTTPEGQLYAWGTNSNNQLGDGTSTTRPTPSLVPTLTGVVTAAAGGLHSLAVTADGQLWSWGYNLSGRLGDGTGTQRTRPVPIGGLPPARAVAAGAAHSLALATTGEVYAFGEGGQGQLGQGTTSDSTVPILVPGLANVVAIAAGANHSLAVTATGEVWAWGDNTASQVAPGATTDRLSPVLVGGITAAVDAAAGSTHTLVRLRDGSLLSWGSGATGKLGLGTTTNQPTPVAVPGVAAAAVAAGTNHTAALGTTGALLGWGSNAAGQVGVGSTPASVLSPTALSGPTGVTALALGSTHSVAVAVDGGVWTWGSDTYAQLGDVASASRPTPAQVWTAPGRWSPPAPMLSLPTGAYTSEQVVLVTSAVPGATLRYTTNGSDPTEADPVVPANGDVLITGTTTLKARAWVPDRAPSVVAAATYTLQPAAPTLSPATGTYVGAQTVTLGAADGLAAIRYTTDGTMPTETSTLYTAPFVVPSTATVQARAFRSGWTPSGTTSATLTIMHGTLATPTASPASGIYQPSEPISLSGPSGATIRYTTDGSEPTAVSNPYVGPLTFSEGAVTLRATAFQAEWYPSATLTATYTLDATAPTITASPFPSSIHGWHSGPVTVSFFCRDSVQLVSCSSPVTVSTTGATTITGTATDAAGNQAEASVTVQLDLVAPAVALTSPTADLTTTDTSITLTGTVADADSGLELVQCNGQDATVDQGVATCTMPLRPGRNSIVLLARDAAGHNTSKGLRVTRTGTSTVVTLTPATRTLLVDETATFSLLDDFGSAISAATWTSSDPAVVAVSTEDQPVLTALAAGTATVTATKNGLSATASITVVTGTSLPDGTTRWTVPATPGTELGTTIYTHRVAEEVPDLFITEKAGTGDYDATYTVKATMGDGSVGWLEAAPGVPTFGDEEGGLVATIGDDASGYPTGLARFAAPAGAAPWRYASTGVLAPATGARPGVAQASDGTIFVAEYPYATAQTLGDARVVALDGSTGAVRATSVLPRETSYSYLLPGAGSYVEPNTIVGPVIGEDGAAYAVYRTERSERFGVETNYLRRWTSDLTLRRMTADGATTDVPIAQFACEGLNPPRLHQCTDGQIYTVLVPTHVVPDGVGGVLVRWNKDLLHPDPNGLYIDEWQGFVTRVVGTTTTEFPMPSANTKVVLIGDGGRVFLDPGDGSNTYAVTAPSVSTIDWTVPVTGTPIHATPEMGAIFADASAGVFHNVSGTGTVVGTTPNAVSAPANTLAYGSWLGKIGATVADTVNVSVNDSPFSFDAAHGVSGNHRAQGQPKYQCEEPKLETNWKGWQRGGTVLYHVEDPANWSTEQLRGLAEGFEEWDRAAIEYQIPIRFRRFEPGETGLLYIFRQGTPLETDYAHTTLNRTEPKPGVVLFARATATDNENYLKSDVGFKKMALHEIGHTLGLRHRWGSKESSVMNQFSIHPSLPEQLGKRRDDPLGNIPLWVTPCDARMAKKSSER